MKYSHSFHSLEAEKGPIFPSLLDTHPGVDGVKSPPPPPGHKTSEHLKTVMGLGKLSDNRHCYILMLNSMYNIKTSIMPPDYLYIIASQIQEMFMLSLKL